MRIKCNILLIIVVSSVFISSCKDNNEDNDHYESLLTGIYRNDSESDVQKLSFSYNGTELTGKKVEFTVKSPLKAVLIFENIISGENKTQFFVDLIGGSGENDFIYEFNGIYETKTFQKINYSGKIKQNLLVLNLDDK
ncbi:MAG: DUF4925 domain-containing protein [Tannerellaceae bacterium]|jgi:hypothetical protein|nr:DUF4925 domain-containing protein [Tannerellaceae bacterium]